jgi:hypothetical protein
MALLYARAGRLTDKNGGFRPGQELRAESCTVSPGTDAEEAVALTTCTLNTGDDCSVASGSGSCEFSAEAAATDPGTFVEVGAQLCTTCVAGTYNELATGAACHDCAAGSQTEALDTAGVFVEVGPGRNRYAVQGVHLTTLGLFLRTSTPRIWSTLSA